jgi:hypothetical protein
MTTTVKPKFNRERTTPAWLTIATGFASERRSHREYSVSDPWIGATALGNRRIHEGMVVGAAARKRSAETRLDEEDRDNQ